MPNPLRPGAHFNIVPGSIWQRPELAQKALTVISSCAASEYQIGSLLATVAGADAADAIVKATNTRTIDKVKTLLAEYADQRLGAEEMKLVSALLVMAIYVQKARNPLVHWMSGYSDNHPDAVLYLNPKRQWVFDGESARLRAGARSDAPDFKNENILVYARRDLDEMLALVSELNEAAELIKFLLGWGLPGPGKVYDRLRTLPRYGKELELLQ